MIPGINYKKFSVLYVDDETQSLKYFQKNLGDDFNILTAENVGQAIDILKATGNQIGVLMTDQRMPGEQGTELLLYARQFHPEITRILATAYSNLETAITAVNDGGAFRYVTKPWDLRELKGILMRALEFHNLHRERNELIQYKVLAWQQIITLDRIRSWAMWLSGASQSNPRVARAFADYVRDANGCHVGSFAVTPESSIDLWSLSRSESAAVVDAAQSLSAPQFFQSNGNTQSVEFGTLMRQTAGPFGLDVESPSSHQLRFDVNEQSAQNLCRVLCEFCRHLSNYSRSITIKISDRIHIGAPLSDSFSPSPLFARANGRHDSHLEFDLLDIYLMAGVCGFATETHLAPGSITMELPRAENRSSTSSPFTAAWFERLYCEIEET